jgi:restriction system protein
MTVKDAAKIVLKASNEPLNAQQIAQRILEQGLWKTEGKTPDQTVAANLYMDIKKHGDRSAFKLVSRGTFTVNAIAIEEAEATTLPEPDSGSVERPQAYSFTECALLVLEEFGSKKPMHYKDITRKALEKGWLVTEGRTPESTMYAQIITEIKRYKASGRSPRFIQHGNGMVGLSKWKTNGVVSEIEQHNQETRKAMLSKLHSMKPVDFEALVSHLLTAMGFESVEVTRYCGDGGIDVRGTLVIGEVVKIAMAIQVKRWKGNIHGRVVRDLRGSIGIHEQGLIITTSDFAIGAKKEAVQVNKTPIFLMNGEQLVTLLMEYSIGVRSTPQVLFDLEDESLYSELGVAK